MTSNQTLIKLTKPYLQAVGAKKLSEEQLKQKEECEKSFYAFVKHAWKVIENREFIDGWHIEGLCLHLQALYNLDFRRLIGNIPFRTGKSNVISVLFPAWCWIQNAGLRFLYTSYSQNLSSTHSTACRRLIQSEWYQSLWGDKFQLMSDVNNKLKFDTNKSGFRMATSVGGANTGSGGDFVICFPFHTEIETEHGPMSIGYLYSNPKVQKVWSFNHLTQTKELKPVLRKMVSRGKKLTEIKFTDGTILECTPDHPIFIPELKAYMPAKDLKKGAKVQTF